MNELKEDRSRLVAFLFSGQDLSKNAVAPASVSAQNKTHIVRACGRPVVEEDDCGTGFRWVKVW